MAHRKNILLLATKISIESNTYTGVTFNDPEYKALEPVVTDEMCEVAMGLKVRHKFTVDEVSDKLKKDSDHVKEQLWNLCKVGVCQIETINGIEYYTMPIWCPGILENMLNNKEQCEKYPVIAECFEEYTRRRPAILQANLPMGLSVMRVIPVNSAIESIPEHASYEEVNRIIENANKIVVGPCSCRRSRRLMGEGCGHLEEDMCIHVNEGAEYYSRIGSSREITKEEAYEILRRAEENGLIHEVRNINGPGSSESICNCCSCGCYGLRLASYFDVPAPTKSNYVAKVDKSKCTACGKCVENCQANAVKLGQKLCTVNPIPEEPKNDNPENTIWTKSHYRPDFRTSRKDVVAGGTAPCKTKCPAHIAVQGYIRLAAQGKYLEALELIKTENPFPAVCGRICNKACEDACTRGKIDEPIAIDDIKKFIADRELNRETRFVPKMLNMTGVPFTEKVAIIGAGPAGLSCAYFLAVKGYPVTVFEKEKVLGGMLTLGIPNFRLEKDVINSEIDVLKEMGVKFHTGVEIGKDITLKKLRNEGYKAFYIAIGAQKSALLGCPGEELEGLLGGIEFLRDVNKGKKPNLGKKVAVIGGGNVSIDVARSAVRLGAEEVVLIYRRGQEEIKADIEEINDAAAEGVQFRLLRAPSEIIGKDGKVFSVKLEIMNLGNKDASGRRSPVGTGEFETIDIDTVITAVGQRIDWNELDIGSVVINKDGTAVADPVTYQTAQPDIFIGGDVYTGPNFAIDAIAAGKEGAESIHRFVHPGQSLIFGRDRRDYHELDKNNLQIPIDGYDNTPRQKKTNVSTVKAKESFNDLRSNFTEEQLKKETERCLECGASIVDEIACLGCGICTVHCKFDAIRLERVGDEPGVVFEDLVGHVLPNMVKRTGKITVKKVSDIITKSQEKNSNK